MARVVWTLQALAQLDAACDYIARDAPTYAALFAGRMADRVSRLRTFPRMGRVVPEIGREDLREIIVQRYRVVYRLLADDTVEIVAVHHGARLLPDFDAS